MFLTSNMWSTILTVPKISKDVGVHLSHAVQKILRHFEIYIVHLSLVKEMKHNNVLMVMMSIRLAEIQMYNVHTMKPVPITNISKCMPLVGTKGSETKECVQNINLT